MNLYYIIYNLFFPIMMFKKAINYNNIDESLRIKITYFRKIFTLISDLDPGVRG